MFLYFQDVSFYIARNKFTDPFLKGERRYILPKSDLSVSFRSSAASSAARATCSRTWHVDTCQQRRLRLSIGSRTADCARELATGKRQVREREKKRRTKRRGGGIGEREGRETGALVGGDEVTPRRGGSLGNLRELTAAADTVRFAVLAIDSQARWAVDGARTRVCTRSEYDARLCARVPRDAGIRGRCSGCVARVHPGRARRTADDLGKRVICRAANCEIIRISPPETR